MSYSEQDIFDFICAHFNGNPQRYASNFNFSACELWLCNEICNIANFELLNRSDENLFLYNEDHKRDLSLYAHRSNGYDELLHHIEVKLIYPTTKSVSDNAIALLLNKLRSANPNNKNSGWIFLVWTSDHKYLNRYSANDFFAQKTRDIESTLQQADPQYVITHRAEFVDGTLRWKGQDKRITVKALAIRPVKSIIDAFHDVKVEYSKAFELLQNA